MSNELDYEAGADCGLLLTAITESGGAAGEHAKHIAGNLLIITVLMKLFDGGYEEAMCEALNHGKALLDILPGEFEHGRQELENMVGILSSHLAEQTKH